MTHYGHFHKNTQQKLLKAYEVYAIFEVTSTPDPHAPQKIQFALHLIEFDWYMAASCGLKYYIKAAEHYY